MRAHECVDDLEDEARAFAESRSQRCHRVARVGWTIAHPSAIGLRCEDEAGKALLVLGHHPHVRAEHVAGHQLLQVVGAEAAAAMKVDDERMPSPRARPVEPVGHHPSAFVRVCLEQRLESGRLFSERVDQRHPLRRLRRSGSERRRRSAL